jgi:hypothetical protein
MIMRKPTAEKKHNKIESGRQKKQTPSRRDSGRHEPESGDHMDG